jgi:hypothetical protein
MKIISFFSVIPFLMFFMGVSIQANAQTIDRNTSDSDIGPVFVKFNKKGVAEYNLNIPANDKRTFVLNGKAFKQVEVKSLKGTKLKYQLHRGKQLLASGNISKAGTQIKSDGRSKYYFSVIADDVIINVVLQWRDRSGIVGR